MNNNDENYRPRIFEQHNKMDWSNELRKIAEKYKINPMPAITLENLPWSHNTTLS
jgi:hypothetical protein